MARWPASEAGHRAGSRATLRQSLPRVLARALAAFAFLLHPASAWAEAPAAHLSFARHGTVLRAATLSDLLSIAPSRTVRVFEPYEGREVAFEAVPLAAVLDAIYSESWRNEEELLFTCLDGYQPGVPVARALAHAAWLAFARADQPEFKLWKLESGSRHWVALGPFYLIWENLDDPEIRQAGDYGWPYQLATIDLVRTQERFPNMFPPPASSSQAMAGFRAFRVHCSRCHRINGDGGTVGQELNTPVSPLDYREREWLARFISDPSAVRPASRMPALDEALADRTSTVAAILAYLEVMARARPVAGTASREPALPR